MRNLQDFAWVEHICLTLPNVGRKPNCLSPGRCSRTRSSRKDGLASRSTLPARPRQVHGIELEAVQAGADGRIILAELPRRGFVGDLQDRNPEGSAGRYYRAMGQQLTRGKLLFAVNAVLAHQGLLLLGDVRRKCRSGR